MYIQYYHWTQKSREENVNKRQTIFRKQYKLSSKTWEDANSINKCKNKGWEDSFGKSTSVKALGPDFESSKSTKPGRCSSTHLLTPWHLRQDGKQETHRPSSLAYTAQTIKKSYSRQARRIRQIPEAVRWRPHEHHSTCVATLTYTLQNK